MNDHTNAPDACPACSAGHVAIPMLAQALPDGSGYTMRKRTVVRVDGEPIQVFHPDHGWGDVHALCPEERGQHALVLVDWHDDQDDSDCGWFTLTPERCERVEWRPVSAFLALYGRADVLVRKGENMREQHERAQREQHERRLVFADSLLSARAHVERVQLALTALREQVEDCPTPDEAEAVTRAAGVLAGIADFLETITQ